MIWRSFISLVGKGPIIIYGNGVYDFAPLKQTEKIIEWDGKMITVTEASQLWQYYSVEKDTEKTELLSQLVIEAKTKIREQYPDEDTSVIDESQVTQEQQEQTVEETVVE